MEERTEALFFHHNNYHVRDWWKQTVKQDILNEGYDCDDFIVICDSNNNTTEIIENNSFVGEVMIKDQDGEFRKLKVEIGVIGENGNPIFITVS